MPKERDEKGRFRKGHSGNPFGRPKASDGMRELVKTVPKELERIIKDEETPVKLKIDLLRWCYEMVNGKPRQQAESEANTSPALLAVNFEGELDEWSE